MSAPGRLQHIHALRGVAALVVIVQHAAQVAQEAGATLYRPLLDSINLGRFGVLLFFLISGLVVPYSFHGERPLRAFGISRLFRLYPAYWLSLPALTLVAAHIGLRHDPLTILANVTMVQQMLGHSNIGPGYWTLTFELVFYALCAVMACRGILRDVALIGAATLGLMALAAAPALLVPWQGPSMPVLPQAFFLAMFLLGMVLRLAFVDALPAARRWATALVPLAVLDGLVLGGAVQPVWDNAGPYFHPTALSTAMALPPLVFVVVLRLRPRPGRIALFLGTISYSAYLFQDVLLRFLPDAIDPGRAPALYLAGVVAGTIAIAAAVNRWVEQPMIAVGRLVRAEGWAALRRRGSWHSARMLGSR